MLPKQFSATVEANFVKTLYTPANNTIHMHEWYDAVNDRGRTDLYHTSRSSTNGYTDSSVYDFKNNRYFRTSPSGCEWGDMAHVGRGRSSTSYTSSMIDSEGMAHITSTEKFFHFGSIYNYSVSTTSTCPAGTTLVMSWSECSTAAIALNLSDTTPSRSRQASSPNGCFWASGRLYFRSGMGGGTASGRTVLCKKARQVEKYGGQRSVRGITCDMWTTQASHTSSRSTSNFTLDYFFSSPDWGIPEDNWTQVPVRVVLKGVRTASVEYHALRSHTHRNGTCACSEARTNGTAGMQHRCEKANGTSCAVGYMCRRSRYRGGTSGTCYYQDPVENRTVPKAEEYHHVYDYTSFHVGEPEASMFERSCGSMCVSTNTTWNGTTLPAIPCPGNCDGLTTPPAPPPPPFSPCLIDGRVDDDCCAIGSRGRKPNATCAAGYVGGLSKTVCRQTSNAADTRYRTCCRKNDTAKDSACVSVPRLRLGNVLPSLPLQFKATIEANFAKGAYLRNTTTHMHEYYDGVNNRGRTDLFFAFRRRSRGSSTSTTAPTIYSDVSIYDFDKNHYYHTSSRGCSYGDMEHLRRSRLSSGSSTPSMIDAEGGAHLTSTADFFQFGGNTTETYQGQRSARGITCDTWTATGGHNDTRSHTNYTMTYFFSTSSWSLPESESTSVPVRVEVKGVRTASQAYHVARAHTHRNGTCSCSIERTNGTDGVHQRCLKANGTSCSVGMQCRSYGRRGSWGGRRRRSGRNSSLCTSTPNWKDRWGTCSQYGANRWCTSSGAAGSGWTSSWGDVNASGVALACCACGGGVQRTAAPTPAPAPSSGSCYYVDPVENQTAAQPEEFHHVYDYTSFHVGAPDAAVFERPCNVSCASQNRTWNATTLPPLSCGKPACPSSSKLPVCSAGYFFALNNQSREVECKPCRRCAANQYRVGYCQEASDYVCAGCPNNSVSPADSTSASNCTCASQFYEALNTKNQAACKSCKSCPANAYRVGVCDGNLDYSCRPCPPNSTSSNGSKAVYQCTCITGFRDVNTSANVVDCQNTKKVGTAAPTAAPSASPTGQGQSPTSPTLAPTTRMPTRRKACPAGQFHKLDAVTYAFKCVNCSGSCKKGQYRVGKCGGNSNYLCSACQLHASSPAGATSETQCTCEPEYFLSANHATRELECKRCRSCLPRQYRDGKCTGSADYNCVSCPLHSTSPARSQKISACKCITGFLDTDAGPGITCIMTQAPTSSPTKTPTRKPTKAPTRQPTKVPTTQVPTPTPTNSPKSPSSSSSCKAGRFLRLNSASMKTECVACSTCGKNSFRAASSHCGGATDYKCEACPQYSSSPAGSTSSKARLTSSRRVLPSMMRARAAQEHVSLS